MVGNVLVFIDTMNNTLYGIKMNDKTLFDKVYPLMTLSMNLKPISLISKGILLSDIIMISIEDFISILYDLFPDHKDIIDLKRYYDKKPDISINVLWGINNEQ